VSYDFLLISWGTAGNLNPLLTAGRQLRQSGHRVRVMADPAIRDEVAAAADPALPIFNTPPRANDNHLVWPLIPFPEGWNAAC
jgi:UDP:flavonoid glycosyltransferase YjiC (YdhE family)